VRRALGRLLGVVLTFVLVSVIALAALSRISESFAARAGQSASKARAPLPLYFNQRPSNVHDRAAQVLARLATGSDPEAARELARLGGAGLPHVLPKLDALRPAARERVAIALAPVAARMDLAEKHDLTSGEKAVAFWSRFWQDHEFDFRPQLVRRVVDRVAARSSALARDELVRLDTYALPELIAALGRIRGPDDIARARRITLLLVHVTGQGPVVDRQASVNDARAVARFWRRFMVEQGADFTTLDGPTRLVAMFAQTQYGRWLGRVFGVIRAGQERQPALGMPPATAIGSALRCVASVLLALTFAVGWAGLELRGGLLARRTSRVAATIAIALPAVFVGLLLGVPRGALGREGIAAGLTALVGAAALSRFELASCAHRLGPATLPWSALVSGVLRAAPASLPWILTSLFGLELCLNIDGAARALIEGLWRSDVSPGMTVALAGTFVAAALAAVADAATGTAPVPQSAPALVEVGGSHRRPWITAAIFTAALLGVFGAGWSLTTSAGPPGWTEVANGARSLLGYGMVTLLAAALTGVVLGALSAVSTDALLVRLVELAAALPAGLWAVALALALGPGVLLALMLGFLRGVDVAWLLRAELLHRTHEDEARRVSSLGSYPLAVYYRRHLRPAALPALSALAMTPAWWVAVGSLGRLIEAPALPGRRGWDTLFAGTFDARTLPAFGAAALITLVTAILLGFVTAAPRRVGAFRASSIPPPPPAFSEDEEEPS
jgi:ABC-type dipeptide/oligopeptide/nickel transport system permease subunit